jgi:16S rRNA (guanine527-N7)-methyltransferase
VVKNLTLELIERRLVEAGYSGPVNVAQQATFIELMAKWNRKINLTALPLDPIGDEAVDRLIVEPVVASQFIEDQDIRIIDLGTGGGSPAIPFRIEVQASSMRMVESRSKKCAFLREATRTLDLKGTSVEESRIELLPGREDLKHLLTDDDSSGSSRLGADGADSLHSCSGWTDLQIREPQRVAGA